MNPKIKDMTDGPPLKLIVTFALPLMVGIVCGAYSSVCLTGAMWYILRKKFPPKVKTEE